MSHFVKIVTMIKDRTALIKALERMGFAGKLEVNEGPVALYGYKGDIRSERAHIVIRRKHVGGSSNDIGFERMNDGRYAAHISEFDQGTGSYSGHEGTYGKTWQGKLLSYYGVEKAKMEFKAKGMSYTEDVDEQERPRLKVRLN